MTFRLMLKGNEGRKIEKVVALMEVAENKE